MTKIRVKCPNCNSENIYQGKVIWMGDSQMIKKLNEKQSIDYHCWECGYDWRNKND